MSLSLNSLTSTVASWFRTPSNSGLPGSASIFCKLPVEVIKEIFDYLSDKDVGTVLRLCKDVNLSINSALEPRIRCAIYALFNESRAFTCRPNAPLYVLKRAVPTALAVIRARKMEAAEKAKTEAMIAHRREAETKMEMATVATSIVFVATIPVSIVINSLSDETISQSMHRYDDVDFNF